MDRACLPSPPLTLTRSILVSFKAPVPPGTPLIVRSNVVEIKEGSQPGVGKVRAARAPAGLGRARSAREGARQSGPPLGAPPSSPRPRPPPARPRPRSRST
jgi:hypothetical protein